MAVLRRPHSFTHSYRRQAVRPVCSSAEQAAVGRRAAMGLGVSLAASLLTGPRDAAYAKDKGGVYWVSPADGATVESPFKVKMGVKGLDVVPAGTHQATFLSARNRGLEVKLSGV